MTMASRRLPVLLTAVVLVFGACGGDDDAADGGAPDDTVAATTTAPSDDGSAGGDEGDAGDLALGFGGECQEALAAMGAAVSGVGGAFSGQVNEDLLQSAEELKAMADAAPDEIRGDLQVIAEVISGFYQSVSDAGIDLGSGETPSPEQIEQLAELSAQFDQEAYQTATDNVTEWFEANCE